MLEKFNPLRKFYNTPARKKFLKTPRTELRKIVDVVRRFGLGFPEVSFKLVSDNRDIFHVKTENLEERIDNLLDPTYSRNLLPISLVKGDYAFSGFVGNLNLVRSRPGEQYLFLKCVLKKTFFTKRNMRICFFCYFPPTLKIFGGEKILIFWETFLLDLV